MSWLPPAKAAEDERRRPWVPGNLPTQPGRLSYIVVDEIIGDAIGLSVCSWPDVDESGRLCFGQPAGLVVVDRAWLEQQLTEHREPPVVAERPLRIGDVFAVADVELHGRREESADLTIAAWTPPIHDLTAAARDAAKAALYGAVAPVLDPARARALDDLVDDVEGSDGNS